MIQLVYASAARQEFTTPELAELLARARERNTELEVSGLLLYKSRSFLQVLEGERDHVDPLYERIGKDRRHDHILLIVRRTVEERTFSGWSMGFANVNLALARKLDGFSDFFAAAPTFVDYAGDGEKIIELLKGFREGLWRRHVEGR
jgi:hypothetical protein